MNTNFDRFRTQAAVEIDLGCTDLDKWGSYKSKFEKYSINDSKKTKLLTELKGDAADLYFKGVYSISEAIFSISQGRHSWSVVKLYYAVFYLLRCSLATRKIAFIKNKGIYTIKLEDGEKPVRQDQRKYLGERVSGDHKTTICTYVSLVGQDDILQTNTIDGQLVYDWLMELRNQVNYRERIFQEPEQRYFYADLFDRHKARQWIERYIRDDSYVYCFDKEHCGLAAPLKLAIIVRKEINDFIDFEPIENQKKNELKKLIGVMQLDNSNDFNQIFEFGRD